MSRNRFWPHDFTYLKNQNVPRCVPFQALHGARGRGLPCLAPPTHLLYFRQILTSHLTMFPRSFSYPTVRTSTFH